MSILMHNQVLRISADELEGIFRVVFDYPSIGKTVLVRLTPPPAELATRRGRPKTKSPAVSQAKPSPLPLVGNLIWMERRILIDLEKRGGLVAAELERTQFKISKADQERYEVRVKAMSPFLDFDGLNHAILASGNIGALVKAAQAVGNASAPLIYKLWSLMCRFGFTAESLIPQRHRCGAPGKTRPCDPGGRQKAGRKTDQQRIARASGEAMPSALPGMSTEWRARIMMADKKIPCPKPKFPQRYIDIINDKFVTRFKDERGELIPLDPTQGAYPSSSQVKRVLDTEIPRLHRLLERTTKGHFARSLRGMIARNWKGVAGPGHTWAMDSTVGDLYLRSSINREWIIGRPIVYIIVDVWSTAIVGFYVCLTGPSWNTAKVSLFNASVDPMLIADLWQYQPMLSLFPYPTLPAVLMCDRGEYLSLGASQTSLKLIPCMSYAPPYRPDLKGLVEVLHRIEKDRQYLWVPGAIDARRKEYDLRRFNPNDAVFTVREYVEYLHIIFAEYNLTADRSKRIDTHMIAAGVAPSPAGLWRWGHEVGVGTRRSFPQSELVSSLLPQGSARITRTGVQFCGLTYESEIVNTEQWTAHARNFGAWNIDVNHFPGSVSRIWTPNMGASGLLDLRLSQQTRASKEQTFDEVLDAFMYRNASKAEIEHANNLLKFKSAQKADAIIAEACTLTQAAVANSNSATPSISESRHLELQAQNSGISSPAPAPTSNISNDEAIMAYTQMMNKALAAANEKGGV